MKLIYRITKIVLMLPFLMSFSVFGPLEIAETDPNLPSPRINEERGYIAESTGEEVLIPRGDINNWTVTGGQIIDFNTTTDAITVRWTAEGEGLLRYKGLTRLTYITLDENNNPVTNTYEQEYTTEKTIQVRDLNDISTYFDTRIVYIDCANAVLKTRGDIPSGEKWYWQFASTGTSIDHEVKSQFVQHSGEYSTDDNMVVSASGSYHIRAYTSSTGWSAAKEVVVNFSAQTFDNYPTWYPDTDGDGYGNPGTTSISSCLPPTGYVDNDLDNCPNEFGKNRGCATMDYVAPNLSTDQNYVYTAVPQVPIKDIANIDKQHDVVEGVSYIDGLGRTVKSIAIGQSPKGNDIISFTTYDEMGRQAKQYLPYTAKTNSGAFSRNTQGIENNAYEAQKFYQEYLTENGETTRLPNVVPYGETLYDDTPASISLLQAAPGKDWAMNSGHETEFGQAFAPANTIRKYKVTYTAGNLLTPTLAEDGFYGYKELYLATVTNENGVKTKTYVNKRGQTVLSRIAQQDTYNIYDDYGNLVYVLSPKVDVSDGVSTIELSKLGYQYIYDVQGRLIEKKDPGREWEYIVYNNLGQAVLVQSPKLKTENRWLFTKYDFFGKAIYTGMYTDTRTRAQLQLVLDDIAQDALYETKLDTPVTGFQGQLYYSNTVFPTTNIELHTISYFDNYTFDRTSDPKAIAPDQVYLQNITDNTLNLATGSKTRVLGTNHWITSVVYYDDYGQALYAFTGDPYLQTVDVSQTKYDFTGKVLKSRSYHKKEIHPAIVTQHIFTYDHTGRLLNQYQCIGDETLSDTCGDNIPQDIALNAPIYEPKEVTASSSILLQSGFSIKATTTQSLEAIILATDTSTEAVERIAAHEYNELGQLIKKEVGGKISNTTTQNPVAGLQTINYTYNIRGWLKGINDVNTLGNDLFAYKLNHNKPELDIYGGNTIGSLYNGNISETLWKTATDTNTYGYAYSYDAYDRLINSYYFVNGNVNDPAFTENVSYDKNGNITTMYRYDRTGTTIDYLQYTYDNDNKLLKVQDQTGNAAGFKDGTNTDDDYTYDVEGNMTSDQNKGITGITYNHFSLPTHIVDQSNVAQQYTYDATGAKLAKNVSAQNGNNLVREYAGNYIYEDHKLKFFGHAEGYVEPVDENDLSQGFIYVYQYTDHLGNIRLSYADNDGDGKIDLLRNDSDIDGDGDNTHEIREEKHYYAFGLQHQYANDDPRNMIRGRKHPYGFNGMELNETQSTDLYEAPLRAYDPVIARWTTQDPVIHHMYSPYSAFDNNPVYYSDPSGADSENWNTPIPYYQYGGYDWRKDSYSGRWGTSQAFAREFGDSWTGPQEEESNSGQVNWNAISALLGNVDNLRVSLVSDGKGGFVVKKKKGIVTFEDTDQQFAEKWSSEWPSLTPEQLANNARINKGRRVQNLILGALRAGADFTPIGSVLDIKEGIDSGDGLQVAVGVVSLGLDIVTFGGASFVKGGIKVGLGYLVTKGGKIIRIGRKIPLPTTKTSKFGEKIADDIITNGVPKNWSKANILDAISDYKMSIKTRKIELIDFMKNGKGDAIGHKLHARRITKEENFLKSLEKAYKNR